MATNKINTLGVVTKTTRTNIKHLRSHGVLKSHKCVFCNGGARAKQKARNIFLPIL